MAAAMSTEAVEEAVIEYMAENHPHLECLEVSMLKLDETWLIQAAVETIDGSEPAERLVLLVGPEGIVKEASGTVPRQSAQRCLAGLKTSALAEAHW